MHDAIWEQIYERQKNAYAGPFPAEKMAVHNADSHNNSFQHSAATEKKEWESELLYTFKRGLRDFRNLVKGECFLSFDSDSLSFSSLFLSG